MQHFVKVCRILSQLQECTLRGGIEDALQQGVNQTSIQCLTAKMDAPGPKNNRSTLQQICLQPIYQNQNSAMMIFS